MVIKNISEKQFSLEGVIIEPGQMKELPDEQAQRFVDIYAHIHKFEVIEPVAEATPEESIASLPQITAEEVAEEIEKLESEEQVPPPLKVYKPRKKKE